MKRCQISVKGLVQGVSFRWYTRDKATELGLTGWVRNEPDGTVRIIAEGERDKLEKLIQWIHTNTGHVHIDGVESSYSESMKEFNDFSIKFE